jgi:hypothetical protein
MKPAETTSINLETTRGHPLKPKIVGRLKNSNSYGSTWGSYYYSINEIPMIIIIYSTIAIRINTYYGYGVKHVTITTSLDIVHNVICNCEWSVRRATATTPSIIEVTITRHVETSISPRIDIIPMVTRIATFRIPTRITIVAIGLSLPH